MIGKTVSHYRIVGQLGSGGMGVVYAAEDDRLGRTVAVKFVPDDLAKDLQAVDRLRGEARTASTLNHPNICTIHDVGEHDGRPFFVMELLQGRSLQDRLSDGPLRIHEAVEMGISVAGALDVAHQRGIIHRDIKPANLFLVERGPVKILDFGLAKQVRGTTSTTTVVPARDQTAEGITLGTVAYMSPEQVTADTLDGRTDLYSLGVVLYECLTGRQPFTGKTSGVIFSAILTQAPIAPVTFNPDLPPRLQDVINNCLEKDRELRYQNAAGLQADLRRVKRDMESGRSTVYVHASPESTTVTGRYLAGARSTAAPVQASDGQAAATSGAHAPSSKTPAVVAAVVAAAVAAGGGYLFLAKRDAAPAQSVTAPAGASGDSFVRNRVSLATGSFESKDYAGAVAYADEALKAAPGDSEATRVRNDARAMLDRFDRQTTLARERLAAGDAEGASKAIEDARAIQPAAPVIGTLSSALVAVLKGEAENARREGQRASVRSSPAPAVPSREAAPAPAARPLPEPAASTAPVPAPPPAPQPFTPPPQPAASAPAVAPAPVVPAPAPPVAVEEPRREPPPPASRPAPPPETDDAAIRRVVSTYARAIESKDIALFRTVKPNLSADEARRIEEGFRAVTSQKVDVTILSIEKQGADSVVRLRRRDTILAGGRQQISESLQSLTMTHGSSGWVIRQIGR